MQLLKTSWRWLTTTRYTRTLEAEVERLRAENRALLNSLLGTAGFPPIEMPETKTQPPIPRVRRRSWHQIAVLREMEELRRARPNQVGARHPSGGPAASEVIAHAADQRQVLRQPGLR